jgi:hypothetical protein
VSKDKDHSNRKDQPKLVISSPEELSKVSTLLKYNESRTYLVDPILPHGQLHQFNGASNAGKTRFIFPMIYDIKNGKDFLGHPSNPSRILYFSCDRNKSEISETLKSINLQYSKIPILTIYELFDGRTHHTGLDFWDNLDLITILEATAKDYDTYFIEASAWFDPTGGTGRSSNGGYAQVIKYLSKLKLFFCERAGKTLICTGHPPKEKSPLEGYKNARDRHLGSVGNPAVLSTIMDLIIHPENPDMRILTVNGKNFKEEQHTFSFSTGIFNYLGEFKSEERVKVFSAGSKVDTFISVFYKLNDEFSTTEFKDKYHNEMQEIISKNTWTKIFQERIDSGMFKLKFCGTKNGNRLVIVKLPTKPS